MKNKDNVLSNFLEMTKNSWTYERMTQDEKDKFNKMINSNRVNDILKGSYDIRWNILNGLYYAYLLGIGYTSFNWREEGVQ